MYRIRLSPYFCWMTTLGSTPHRPMNSKIPVTFLYTLYACNIIASYKRQRKDGSVGGRPEVESPKQQPQQQQRQQQQQQPQQQQQQPQQQPQQPVSPQVGPAQGFGRGNPAGGVFDGPNNKRRRY